MKDRVLRKILSMLDALSARIRCELRLDEPTRRPTTVLEARSLWRTPYRARTFSRRKFAQPVTFESGDDSD